MKTVALACLAVLGVASASLAWEPVPFAASENGDHWDKVAQSIVDVVNEAVPSADGRKEIIRKHIATLQFEYLEKDIPHLFDDVDVSEFVGKIATCGRQNSYLDNFMSKAAAHRPAFYSDKDDVDEVVPDAVFYAVVLDRLTEAIRNDHTLLDKMYESIMATKEKVMWREYTNLFEKAKTATMDLVISRYAKMLNEGEVPGNWGRRTLSLNILEASLEDYRLGNSLNAQVALIMALEPPGSAEYDPKTGAGPSSVTEDGNGIRYVPPRPDLYADLYSTWNSAFVSHYDNAPHFWAKLLNPQVGCYQDDPELYVYNRAVALWLHVYWEMFNRVERGSADPWYHWADQDLTTLWEAVNYESGEHYLNTLEEARPGMANFVHGHIKAVLRQFGHASGTTIASLQNLLQDITSMVFADGMSLSSMVSLAWNYGSTVVDIIKAFFS